MKTKLLTLMALALPLCSCGGGNAKISETEVFNQCVAIVHGYNDAHNEFTYEVSDVRKLNVVTYDYGWVWYYQMYRDGYEYMAKMKYNTYANVSDGKLSFCLTYDEYREYPFIIWAR